eukprot:942301-Prymnesium_polylepis.1
MAHGVRARACAARGACTPHRVDCRGCAYASAALESQVDAQEAVWQHGHQRRRQRRHGRCGRGASDAAAARRR